MYKWKLHLFIFYFLKHILQVFIPTKASHIFIFLSCLSWWMKYKAVNRISVVGFFISHNFKYSFLLLNLVLVSDFLTLYLLFYRYFLKTFETSPFFQWLELRLISKVCILKPLQRNGWFILNEKQFIYLQNFNWTRVCIVSRNHSKLFELKVKRGI